MAACEEAIQSILTFDKKKLTKLREQADTLAEKVRNRITLRARVEGETLEKEYVGLTAQYERVVKRIEVLEAVKADGRNRARMIELYMRMLDQEELDAVQFAAFLEKAVMSGEKMKYGYGLSWLTRARGKGNQHSWEGQVSACLSFLAWL